MKRIIITFLLIPAFVYSQNFTSYITGNNTDITTNPLGGICLMGGATEDDNAMKWFLQRANGGDVLVLRATGSNGYNNYLYSTLGVSVNSVETIVCNNPLASFDPYVLQKIQQAEAIWFAGGNQWTYISYWRNTPVDSLINIAINQRKVVIGGTSAGMAIQGKYYFSAQNGTITSATAINDPYNNLVTVDSTEFVKNKFLENIITDTHFDNPDRKGRLVAFMARILTDYGSKANAVACDEYTSICIDTNGIASVYGGYPNYDDNAYFIQTNCELSNQNPEVCVSGSALTWDLGGSALKVYAIKGTPSGSGTFNLKNWQNGNNGTWLEWSVNSGLFAEQISTEPDCGLSINGNEIKKSDILIYPNPALQEINISYKNINLNVNEIELYNSIGEKIKLDFRKIGDYTVRFDIETLCGGVYQIRINSKSGIICKSFIIK